MSLSLEGLLETLRGAGETTRLRIVALLSEAELTVSEVTEILRQSQPVISRHLKVLHEAGVVERYREGSWAFFRLASQTPSAALVQSIVRHLDPADTVVVHDRERLAKVRAERATEAQQYFSRYAAQWDDLRQMHVADDEVERAIHEAVGTRSIPAFLDIGTGTGRMLELLGPQSNHGIGVDLSREMLAIARTKLDAAGLHHCGVQLGDLHDLPFGPNSFDLVAVHQVLHLLDDAPQALQEARRVLKPGGRLLVVDFAPHDHESLREQHAHRRLGFADDIMTAWLQEGGLDVISHHTVAAAPNARANIAVSIWVARDPRLSVTRPHSPRRRLSKQGAPL
jgi:ubiquinone/menaquinone biosynthesis C-methylase UbiE/Fe2+ or Zn2+ uptake regulation protein